MAKRKLTRKQNWRVQKVQDEKAKRMEKKLAKAGNDEHLGSEQKGLVVSHFGTFVEVEPLPLGVHEHIREGFDDNTDDEKMCVENK